jgi:hypothetical protein
MKKSRKIKGFYSLRVLLLLFFISTGFICYSQKDDNIKKQYQSGDTLYDNAIGMKIFSDTSRKSITATDSKNKLIWQSSPWEEKEFRAYDSSINNKFESNYIESFFVIHNNGKYDPFIYLNFFNSLITAVIERNTGKLFLIEVK